MQQQKANANGARSVRESDSVATMLNGQKIVVVMPAYNAARTLQKTYDEVMEQGIVDLVIVVDDASHDETAAIARTLESVQVEVHPENRGYGGNQKTCYRLALAAGADIVIMIHPDYQYTPLLLPAMASLVASGLYPCVLASRILGGGALEGGMPWWKYISNRFLTLAENFLIGAKLSDTTQAIALLPAACSRSCRSKKTLTISCSIIKFSLRLSGLAATSVRSRARRNICRKPRRLIFAEACVMVLAVWARPCVFVLRIGD